MVLRCKPTLNPLRFPFRKSGRLLVARSMFGKFGPPETMVPFSTRSTGNVQMSLPLPFLDFGHFAGLDPFQWQTKVLFTFRGHVASVRLSCHLRVLPCEALRAAAVPPSQAPALQARNTERGETHGEKSKFVGGGKCHGRRTDSSWSGCFCVCVCVCLAHGIEGQIPCRSIKYAMMTPTLVLSPDTEQAR